MRLTARPLDLMDNDSPQRGAASAFHPLCVEGTVLPGNLLLLAKLIALFLLGLGYVEEIKAPFLPMLGWPEVPAAGRDAVQFGLRLGLVTAALGLLFNRAVRVNCLVIAAVLMASMLLTRQSFANAKFYAALVLLIIGLYDGVRTFTLLRWQLVIMYFGAALNKLLDADWQTGVFFDHWMGSVLDKGWYHQLAGMLPERWLAMAMSWGTIVTEFVLVVCFAWRRLLWLGVALAVVFHSISVVAAGTYFGVYFPALAATMFGLTAWPKRGALALPDGLRGARWVKRMDLDGRFSNDGERLQGVRGALLAWLTLPMTWWLVFLLVYVIRCVKVGHIGV